MAQQAARLRRAGHDQIVIALAHFVENLIDYDPVPKTHFSRNAEPFEFSLLPPKICSEFRLRLQQLSDVLLQAD